MSNTAASVLEIARGELGYSRWDDPQPGTKYGRWYEEQIDRVKGNYDFGASGVPYCAMFASWVLAQAGASCAGFPGAYCPTIVQTGRNRGKTVPTASAQPGDVVLFDWEGDGVSDHVGICEANCGTYLQCIEGNTNNGVVARRTRAYSSVVCVIRPDWDSPAPAAKTAKPRVLYGIDVSSNQPEDIVARAENDFAIVKMSGNPQSYAWDYVNPYAKRQAADAMAKHGRLGLYHFTWGKDAATEAEFFVAQVKKLGYLGKAMLVIDYEGEALNLGRGWVKKFAQRVEELAGYRPVIYASGSVVVGQDLLGLGYPIWCANYSKGYQQVSGRSTDGLKIYAGCEKSTLWQFTSQGKVGGYDGLLDCNAFYGEDWSDYAGSPKSGGSKPLSGGGKSSEAKLEVDGYWGKKTTSALQRALGTPVDGIVSDQHIAYKAKNPGLDSSSWEWHQRTGEGSMMVKALQRKVGASVDGIAGDETFTKLQRYLGTPADGVISSPSKCVKELQRRLNAGSFR